jgi:hypothetical protein
MPDAHGGMPDKSYAYCPRNNPGRAEFLILSTQLVSADNSSDDTTRVCSMAAAIRKLLPVVEAFAEYESKRSGGIKSCAQLAQCIGRIVSLDESMRPPEIFAMTCRMVNTPCACKRKGYDPKESHQSKRCLKGRSQGRGNVAQD